MNESRDTYEIDVRRLLRAMVKNWWVMVIPALVIAVLVYTYISFYVVPSYRATVSMYVNTATGSSGYSELNTARETVEDYVILLKKPETATMIHDNLMMEGSLNGSYTISQISSMISASYQVGSSFIDISVTCPDAQDASLIVNMAMQVLPKLSGPEYYNFPSTIGFNLGAMAEGTAPMVSNNLMKNTLIGFIFGLLLGMVVILLREMFDDNIQSEDWVKQTFKDEIPILAIIPSADRADQGYKGNRYGSYYRHYDSSTK
jgi:capsular polysaccharide biosynthesis protein